MLSRHDSAMKGRMDWTLVGAAFGLVLIGSVSIISAAAPLPYSAQIVQRHFLAVALGILAFLFGLGFNYQIFQDQSKAIYGVAVAVMIAVLVMGETIRGHKAWIRLPYFAFQPSELAKLLTVLVFANYLDRRAGRIEALKTVPGAMALAAPVIGLIVLEPDYSSAVAFCAALWAMLFCAGAALPHLLTLAAFAGAAGTLLLAWTFLEVRPELVGASQSAAALLAVSHSSLALALAVAAIFAAAYLAHRFTETLRAHVPWVLFLGTALVLSSALCAAVFVNRHIKDYQRNRFLVYLVPESDPQEAAYNVNQALVAIGSGGFFGKGVFSGTQSRLGFLPERHTDFIYAVVGEEFGFAGAVLVLGLYLLLLWRIVDTARLARDRYGCLVCAGIGSVFGVYLLVNVGMCLGLVPVAGIPLPLISYGGSNLVVSLWALGVAANVYSKCYAFI